MDKIMLYDLIFLVVFCLAVFIFLYKNRTNLKREGWMYLYRTQLGMKIIDKFSKNNSKLLHSLKYLIVSVGYILMVSIIYLLGKTVYIYIAFPQISDIIKAPPVMPLIPYFTQIFGVENYMPNFYFSYFLIALVVVAVVHEFSHGIYMRLFNTKIKSTGFAFLGPILGAFVEQDEKDFEKKKNFDQRVVLSAGVFANILFALIFFLILVGFFNLSYSPSGYVFDGYASGIVSIGSITAINPINENFTQIISGNKSYIFLGNESFTHSKLNSTEAQYAYFYFDSPAIRNRIRGAMVQINDNKIISRESLSAYMLTKKPGENVTIKTIYDDAEYIYQIELAENPENTSKPFIGISSSISSSEGIMEKIIKFFTDFKESSTYYTPNYNKDVADYFYNLIWWVMMINLFVGLFNMLPLGILDGGRFFYLTILSITKNKKVAEKSFKWATKLIGLIFLAMIVAWAFSLF